MGLAFATHWNLVLPDRLRFLWDKVGDLGCHVARRHAVRTGKLHPFDCEGLAEMDNTGLGSCVSVSMQLEDRGRAESYRCKQIGAVEC